MSINIQANSKINQCAMFILIIFLPIKLLGYDSPNNSSGISGYINMPSAIISDEGTVSFGLYRGDPERKILLKFAPYDWVEGSIFYSDLTGIEYGGGFKQSYKDKGFNIKFKLKDQGKFPAVSLGLNDFAGTGIYSSEYLVATQRSGKFDASIGVGWGNLAGYKSSSNPFKILDNSFAFRDDDWGEGGDLNFKNYFSGDSVSIFGGINYSVKKNIFLTAEYDSSITDGFINFEKPKTNINLALTYKATKFLSTTISFERGNYFGVKFWTSDNISKTKSNDYIKPQINTRSMSINLISALSQNDISLQKVAQEGNRTNLYVRQNKYNTNQEFVSVMKKIINDLEIDNYEITVKNYNRGHVVNSIDIIDKKINKEPLNEETLYILDGEFPRYYQKLSPRLRNLIGSREGLHFWGLFLEHSSQFMFDDSFFIDSLLSYSLGNNFDELFIPPVDTYPNQVRSDIKDYLKGLDNGIAIRKLNVNKFSKFGSNNYLYTTAGVLEDMFSGFGFEYLKHEVQDNISIGFEIFRVKKRDYKFNFKNLDYMKTTAHLNFYTRFPKLQLYSKLSWGQYLAGDEGGTVKVWRRFNNGAEIGAYATFTDVSFEEYGEGSFNKGIFFKIPIKQNNQLSFVDFNWQPLTKDPGSKLSKSYEIYDDLLRFF